MEPVYAPTISTHAQTERASILAIKLVVAADAATFAALAIGAILARRASDWAPALDRTSGLVLTTLLLATSVLLVIARGRRLVLVVAAALGLAFCALTLAEWRALLAETSVAATAKTAWFTVITGYHALHVLVGALALLAVCRGAVSRSASVVLSWYWHFVDAVWLVIAALFYL